MPVTAGENPTPVACTGTGRDRRKETEFGRTTWQNGDEIEVPPASDVWCVTNDSLSRILNPTPIELLSTGSHGHRHGQKWAWASAGMGLLWVLEIWRGRLGQKGSLGQRLYLDLDGWASAGWGEHLPG